MSEEAGEKTELPTQKKIDEAFNKGQFARSSEIQTVFVLGTALLTIVFTGNAMWNQMLTMLISSLGHLHEIPLTINVLPGYTRNGALLMGSIVGPLMLAVAVAGLLAGGLQTRFRPTPEAVEWKWQRLDPIQGVKRTLSFRAAVPTLIALVKLATVLGLAYGLIRGILSDPIFYSTIDVARIADFLADSADHPLRPGTG